MIRQKFERPSPNLLERFRAPAPAGQAADARTLSARDLPPLDPTIPVLLLGGGGNSVAATRNLARAGIPVRLAGSSSAWGVFSRYRTQSFIIPDGQPAEDYWSTLLLGPQAAALHGHVLIALDDEAIAFLCHNHAALSQTYVVEDMDPDLRLRMLDKKATLAQARAAGVGAPEFWTVNSLDDLARVRAEATFPLMVKPIHSHLFVRAFGCKLFIVEKDFDDVADKVRLALDHGLRVMVCEMVPGPDTQLSSYYTYIDAGGHNLFHYTKSIIRRYPVNRGGASLHLSEWRPETAAEGQKFFASMPWRGIANIEFKLDRRDGRLKVIEVNPRFTDAHRLMTAAGLPLDTAIYRSLTGQPVPRLPVCDRHLRMWNPLRDFMAFREMRRAGDLGLGGWLKSIGTDRKVRAMFSPTDPVPSVVRLRQELARARRGAAG